MAKLDYVYTDGLEAIYVDGILFMTDEIIDVQRALDLTNIYRIEQTEFHRIDQEVFEIRYGLEFPFMKKNIFKDDLISLSKVNGMALN